MSEIKIVRTTTPKEKPQDETKLGFGAVTTDHMFIMNYTEGKGWHDPRIVPYGPIELDPFAKCLHYGQEVFEGLKAYRGDEGQVLLFRPDENFKRINRSNDRMCIPQLDEALCLDALHKLVELDKDWVPHAPGTSLYIRPFVIATEAKLGTDSSKTYLFLMYCLPPVPIILRALTRLKSMWKQICPGGPRRYGRGQNRRQLRLLVKRAGGSPRAGLFPGFVAGWRRAQIH